MPQNDANLPQTKAGIETSGTAEAPSSLLEQENGSVRRLLFPVWLRFSSSFPLCNLPPALLSERKKLREFIFESADCFYSSMNYLLHAVLLTQTST